MSDDTIRPSFRAIMNQLQVQLSLGDDSDFIVDQAEVELGIGMEVDGTAVSDLWFFPLSAERTKYNTTTLRVVLKHWPEHEPIRASVGPITSTAPPPQPHQEEQGGSMI